MPFRIAVISVHSCPLGNLGARNTGGMSVYVRQLCRELGRRGHFVDIFTRAHPPLHEPLVELSKNVRLIHLDAGKTEEGDKLALFRHLDAFAARVESFRRQQGLAYDLLNTHYWLSGWVGTWLQQWWGTPHITVFHTLGAVKDAVGIGSGEPKLRINTEKALVKLCQRIIAPTEREKDHLVHYYNAAPETIRVIPCGVNLDLFRPLGKAPARSYLGLDGQKIALFVGRVVALKGVDRLLQALPLLEKKDRPEVIVIGGDEHCRDELRRLEKLTRKLQIQDRVSFPGLVRQEKLPYFYSAADLCVFPSYYESFGLAALESLACGTPVVAPDVGGFRQFIRQGETGFMVADNSPGCLAPKIASITAGSAKNPELASSGIIRRSVARFCWKNIAAAVEKEFRTALKA